MATKHRSELVPLDRHPLAVYLLGLSAWSGIGGAWRQLAGQPNVLTWWLDLIWYVLLIVGSVMGLAGTFWRDPITGVLIVRAGMWPLGAGAVLYAATLSATGRYVPAFMVAAYGAACIWRAVQVSHGTPLALRTVRQRRRPQ